MQEREPTDDQDAGCGDEECDQQDVGHEVMSSEVTVIEVDRLPQRWQAPSSSVETRSARTST
jgi:hypothetical protein